MRGEFFASKKAGSGLRLSQSAIPGPLSLGVRHLPCGASHPCSGHTTCSVGQFIHAQGFALVLRGRPVGLSFPERMGGATHPPCPRLKSASGAGTYPAGRLIARGGSCTHYGGAVHCAWGDSHLCGGADHSPCVPALPARLNACALTIPLAGRCPRPDGLPQQPGPAGRNSCSFAAWGARRAPSVARQPVRPTPFP